jgi:threonine/homoserine/homoserine lactone efflux protein
MAPGPLLAVLLAKSHRSGWAGTQMALGHAVFEVPLILVIYFGFGSFFQNDITQIIMSILGGGMIIWMGTGLFRNRKGMVQKGKDLSYNAFIAGILMTGLNPFFLLWWATIGIMWTMKFIVFGITGLIIFIMVHWLCDLIWLSFVSALIFRSKSLWKANVQEWISIGCSLMMAGFGGWFIISGIQLII